VILESNKIYLGDCLELMKDIQDKSIDLILVDPPYGIHSLQWDSILPFDELWKQYERIIKAKGNILIFSTNMFAHKLALSNEKLYRYDLIWKKSKNGSPLTCKYMPAKKHEYILVFGKSAAKYNPQMEKGEPYKRKWTPNKINNMQYGIEGVVTDNKGTRHPTTILDFPQKWSRQQQGKLHPTLKPVALCEWLIKSYSDENDLVLDNCMGSGTTCLAAKLTNRRYIGMEKEEKYFNIAKKRIEENIIL
jgi:site-specific DNA-methyltransferase (adenine-specific)